MNLSHLVALLTGDSGFRLMEEYMNKNTKLSSSDFIPLSQKSCLNINAIHLCKTKQLKRSYLLSIRQAAALHGFRDLPHTFSGIGESISDSIGYNNHGFHLLRCPKRILIDLAAPEFPKFAVVPSCGKGLKRFFKNWSNNSNREDHAWSMYVSQSHFFTSNIPTPRLSQINGADQRSYSPYRSNPCRQVCAGCWRIRHQPIGHISNSEENNGRCHDHRPVCTPEFHLSFPYFLGKPTTSQFEVMQ